MREIVTQNDESEALWPADAALKFGDPDTARKYQTYYQLFVADKMLEPFEIGMPAGISWVVPYMEPELIMGRRQNLMNRTC
jgi:hypothetical protein